MACSFSRFCILHLWFVPLLHRRKVLYNTIRQISNNCFKSASHNNISTYHFLSVIQTFWSERPRFSLLVVDERLQSDKMAYVFRAKCNLTWSLLTNQTFAMTLAAVQFNFLSLSRQIVSTDSQWSISNASHVYCLLPITTFPLAMASVWWSFAPQTKTFSVLDSLKGKSNLRLDSAFQHTVGQNNTYSFQCSITPAFSRSNSLKKCSFFVTFGPCLRICTRLVNRLPRWGTYIPRVSRPRGELLSEKCHSGNGYP